MLTIGVSQDSVCSQGSQGSQSSVNSQEVIQVNENYCKPGKSTGAEDREEDANRYCGKRNGISIGRHDIPKKQSPTGRPTVKARTPVNVNTLNNSERARGLSLSLSSMDYISQPDNSEEMCHQEQFISRSQMHLTHKLQQNKVHQLQQHIQLQQQQVGYNFAMCQPMVLSSNRWNCLG